MTKQGRPNMFADIVFEGLKGEQAAIRYLEATNQAQLAAGKSTVRALSEALLSTFAGQLHVTGEAQHQLESVRQAVMRVIKRSEGRIKPTPPRVASE